MLQLSTAICIARKEGISSTNRATSVSAGGAVGVSGKIYIAEVGVEAMVMEAWAGTGT